MIDAARLANALLSGDSEPRYWTRGGVDKGDQVLHMNKKEEGMGREQRSETEMLSVPKKTPNPTRAISLSLHIPLPAANESGILYLLSPSCSVW